MFKTLKYFAEKNITLVPESFNEIPENIVKEDLNNINETELINFYEKNKQDLNFLYNIKENESIDTIKKEDTIKKHFILEQVSIKI